MRPKQWTKNLLVFAALLFSFGQLDVRNLLVTLAGFLLFCFISGRVYILNDYIDREADRVHPVKRLRPIASGRLNPKTALSFGGFLLVLSLGLAYLLQPLFSLLLLLFFVINVSYSLRLKHIVIIDIMAIASGFVLRALGGGLIIGVTFTPGFCSVRCCYRSSWLSAKGETSCRCCGTIKAPTGRCWKNTRFLCSII
ncbi:UbiA prenyltransferase family protein [Paenibacillus sp. P26]|nr:UbiA prenyltransferase family protein [Paenibacillus sp. P26]